ncbi:MAG: DPP IV N-terminal domain-containing protein, partial [Gammaproteobacteria bacterium]|nr:DPP IV N-terminal domain-containing protein [Gammaproteobacteria bacterium]
MKQHRISSRQTLSVLALAASSLLAGSLLVGCDRAATPNVKPAATAASEAQATKPAFANYSAEQFYATKSYQGSAINHNGQSLLVASDESGVFNLYRVSLDGKSWQPLTQSTTNAMLPVDWFPEDDRVLYTADQGGNELNHLYVLETDGKVVDLTPGDKLKAMFAGWQGDAAFFVVSNERDPKFFDLYRYDAKTYQRTLVYQNTEGFEVASISDDGRYLALSKQRTNADNNLYLLDLEDPAKT